MMENRRPIAATAFFLFSALAPACVGKDSAIPTPPGVLTLAQAESVALANQPLMLAAQLRAQASAERVREARSSYWPTVAFNATGARVAEVGTAIAAGNLTTSSISDRFAYGGSLAQLVTDFGRTSALVGSARSSAEAQRDLATLTRAQVRLNLREAYYRVLGAEAVLRTAEAVQVNRQLLVRQVSSLARSQIRSTLDENFAEVLESEAELAVVRAESIVTQQRSALASAMGLRQPVAAALEDVASPADALPSDSGSLVERARTQRADLNAAEAQRRAAAQFALSEKRLSYPTLNLLAAAGQVPYHDATLHNDYAAAGVNLSIPIFNGGLFAERRAEAEMEASARALDVQEIQLQVGEQVRDAWDQANEALRSLAVTSRLVVQSKETLRLARDRYETGLGSIVELSEAQLNETSAEIEAADAKYTYLTRCADLDFASGLLN